MDGRPSGCPPSGESAVSGHDALRESRAVSTSEGVSRHRADHTPEYILAKRLELKIKNTELSEIGLLEVIWKVGSSNVPPLLCCPRDARLCAHRVH